MKPGIAPVRDAVAWPDLEVRPVDHDDVIPLIAMSLGADGEPFVAANAVTLAQAPYEGGAEVFCLWAGGERVGLLGVIDLRLNGSLAEDDDAEAAFLWRLMIDVPHRGKGYGAGAVEAFLDWTRAKGLERAYAWVEPGNHRSLALHRSRGFVPTGRRPEGEIELRHNL